MIDDVEQEIVPNLATEITREFVVVDPGKLELAYVADGPVPGEPVILVHGLGQTIADWPDSFVSALAANGFRLVRFDNRDSGRSSRFARHGEPLLVLQSLGAALGFPGLVSPPYSMGAMAADLLALMDALDIRQAHLVGVSMGGMIVQRVAALAGQRIRSMTCIMSSSGAPRLSRPRADVEAALTAAPSMELADMLDFRRLIAAPLTASDEVELAARVTASFAYGAPHGRGTRRQYAAILADTTRYRLLGSLTVPSLVIHGEDDPFVRADHGLDLADRIPGADRFLIPRMGHEITKSFAPVLARIIAEHIRNHSATIT